MTRMATGSQDMKVVAHDRRQERLDGGRVMETHQYVDLDLGEGLTMRAEVADYSEGEAHMLREKAELGEIVPWVSRMGQLLYDAVDSTKAKNAEAEFGLKLEAGSGQGVKWALDVSGEASLKVTLKWEFNRS